MELITQARTPPGKEQKDVPPLYDCDHEKKRKEQLVKLFSRTPEQVSVFGASSVYPLYYTLPHFL